jgi:hypothetical protein
MEQLLKTLQDLQQELIPVTITDANGCTTNVPVTVGTDNVNITATPVITNTTCTASIGAINLNSKWWYFTLYIFMEQWSNY